MVSPPPWPEKPYKGLPNYGPEDQALYAGREGDIARCGALLLMPDTKVLLLHGKTASGKSSFLNAGLIPFVQARSSGSEFFTGRPTAYAIRCTNAPVAKIADAVFSLGGVGMTWEEFQHRVKENPRSLVTELAAIGKKRSKTLIFVLDQAEEVLTLNPTEDSVERKNFFRFLQDFNSRLLDFKFVISLRTEFYGRFVSAINLDYSPRSGAKQYLLEDFTKEQLQAAIERPTLENEIEPFGRPFDKYRFRFENGLAARVAREIVEKIPRGGPLPVMQIVCKALFEDIDRRDSNRTITSEDYKKLGGIEGAIDGHISRSLQQTFERAELPKSKMEDEEELWRSLLCRLVKVGGDGTVYTDVLPASAAINEAKELHTSVKDVEGVLEDLARGEALLLRKTTLLQMENAQPVEALCLGHDAIGLALNAWRTTSELKKANRAVLRKFYYGAIAVALLITAVVITAIWISKSNRRTAMQTEARRMARQAKAYGRSNYQLGTLLAVASNSYPSSFDSDTIASLDEAIVRAPDLHLKVFDKKEDLFYGRPLVSGDRIIAVNRPGRQTYLVTVKDGQLSRLPIDNEKSRCPATNNTTANIMIDPYFYWSEDGGRWLSANNSYLEVSRGSLNDILCTKQFLAQLRMVPRDAIVQVFGRETVFAYKTGPNDNSVSVWRLQRGRERDTPFSVAGPPVVLKSLIGIGQRSILLGINQEKTWIWDLQQGKQQDITDLKAPVNWPFQTAAVQGPRVRTVAFAPDDSALALFLLDPQNDTSIQIVEPRWNEKAPARHSFAWNSQLPAGTTSPNHYENIALGSAQNHWLISVWDATGAIRLATLYKDGSKPDVPQTEHLWGTPNLIGTIFTDNSKYLVGYDRDNQLLLWDVDLQSKNRTNSKRSFDEKIRTACTIAGRTFTPEEVELNAVPGEVRNVCASN
jgi:hypothetical protein